MTDYTEQGAVPVDDAAVDDPPTVDEVLERARQRSTSGTTPTEGDTAAADRTDGMADVGAPDGQVVVDFHLPADVAAESASVVGDFNDWDPMRGTMQRDASGAFSCSLTVPTGTRYQYRYLLDGARWTNDWSSDTFAPNAFGGEDSLLDLSDRSPDGAGPFRSGG